MNESLNQGFSWAAMAPDLLLGLIVGLVASAIFFVGLNWGMRRALRSKQPALVLLASFIVRALVLLGMGWWVVSFADTLWTGIGFLIAFFVVRTFAIRAARKAANNPSNSASRST